MQPVFYVALVQAVTLTHGPMLGHVGTRDANVWARTAAPTRVVLEVIDDSRKVVQTLPATSAVDRDLCLTWTVANLEPAQRYTLRIGSSDVDSLELRTQAENAAHSEIGAVDVRRI